MNGALCLPVDSGELLVVEGKRGKSLGNNWLTENYNFKLVSERLTTDPNEKGTLASL